MDEEIIILEEETEIIEEIEIAEGASVVNDGGVRHNTLVDRNDAGSHEISAINGLRAELDKIETPRVIESNMRQQADYYKWEDENNIPTYPIGRFVSLYTYDKVVDEDTTTRNGTGNICLCDGTTDVFGVIVENAGFVGNQAYTALENGTKIGRNGKYNLVAHSGIVAVQKQTDVAVGDYVVPDTFGKAKRADEKYGYLVTGLSDLYGEQCAIISLSAPSTIAKEVSDTLYYAGTGLVGRMEEVEKDIGNLTTFTNSTYELAQSIKSMQDKQSDLEKSTNSTQETVGNLSDKLDEFEDKLGSLEGSVNNALSQAEIANTTAVSIRSEAVAIANDAVASVDEIQKDIQALDYQIAPYSVGEYSQAYGLTWEQAKGALTVGQVHIPAENHDEFYYEYSKIHKNFEGEPSDYQKFTKTCYYTWNGEQWIPSNQGTVSFAPFDPTNTTVLYWYVTADTADYKKGDLVYWNNGKYEVVANISENGFSRAVNYLRKTANETSMELTNAKGDCASLSEKLDADGARVAMVASVVTEMEGIKPSGIFTTMEELPAAPDANAYYCVGEHAPYDVYRYDTNKNEFAKELLIYYDGVNFCKVNTASIITAVNQDKSSMSLNADKIDFTANKYTIDANHINFTATADYSVLADNITLKANQLYFGDEDTEKFQINAKNINFEGAENLNIDAKNINFEAEDYKAIADNITLDADNITLDGYVTFEVLKNVEKNEDGTNKTFIKGGNIETDSLSAISGNLGIITAGVIQSPHYINGDKAIEWKLDSEEEISETDNEESNIVTEETEEQIDSETSSEDTLIDASEYLIFEYDSTTNTYAVTGLDVSLLAKSYKVVIPEMYDDGVNGSASVTGIGFEAFYDCTNLTSVIIPNSITYIDECAFYNCSSLTDIVIPNNVTWIAEEAFGSCYNLISVIIPDGVTKIGRYAFSDNDGLVVIYCEVTHRPSEWSGYWNKGCRIVWDYKNNEVASDGYIYTVVDGVRYSLKDAIATVVRQPSNITIIPSSIIYKEVSYSVTTIGEYAFVGCTSLNTITIPNSVTSIEGNAFNGCTNLTSITIPNSVTSIGYSAFQDCSSLTHINIPDSVTTINGGAFHSCSSLIDIVIPDSVTSIEFSVFEGCTSLNKMIIHDGITTIGQGAFRGCTNLKFVVIGDSVTSIKSHAFSGCSNLMAVIIGSSVIEIEEYAFYNCDKLIDVYNQSNIYVVVGSVENGYVAYYAENVYEDGNLYTDENYIMYIDIVGTILISYKGKEINLVLSKDIKEIYPYAFYENTAVKTILIPNSVKKIGEAVFNNMQKVYYEGTQIEWNEITDNIETDAIIYYYSATEPARNNEGTAYENNYWYYNNSNEFCISSDLTDEYLIDSAFFKLSHNGIINASSGLIGNLNIQKNILSSDNFCLKTVKQDDGVTYTSFTIYDPVSNEQYTTITNSGISSGYIQTDNINSFNGVFETLKLNEGLNIYQHDLISNTGHTALMFDADYSYTESFVAKITGINEWDKRISITIYEPNITEGEERKQKNLIRDKTFVVRYWFYGDTSVSTCYITVKAGESYAISSVLRSGGFGFETDSNSVATSVYIYTQNNNYDPFDDYTFSQGEASDNHTILCRGNFVPDNTVADVYYNLGTTGKPWGLIYNQSGTLTTSDKNEKNTIEPLAENYSEVFDMLKPVTYKYNVNTSDRLHTGFIAQDVKEALDTVGIDSKNFAAYCEWTKDDGSIGCGLRYEEFIALCVDQIQKLKKRVEVLENQLNTTQND